MCFWHWPGKKWLSYVYVTCYMWREKRDESSIRKQFVSELPRLVHPPQIWFLAHLSLKPQGKRGKKRKEASSSSLVHCIHVHRTHTHSSNRKANESIESISPSRHEQSICPAAEWMDGLAIHSTLPATMCINPIHILFCTFLERMKTFFCRSSSIQSSNFYSTVQRFSPLPAKTAAAAQLCETPASQKVELSIRKSLCAYNITGGSR